MDTSNLVGKLGEKTARNYLIKKGYTILHSNWRWGKYELDIVATKDNKLVVVEVKTRTKGYLLPPLQSINHGKIRRIVAAINAYVQTFNVSMPVRVDIMTLIKDGNAYSIEHIEDARLPSV